MQLNEALTHYLEWHRNKGHSNRTISSVSARMHRFIDAVGDVAVTAVSKRNIHDYFMSLQASGLAAGTLAGHKSTMRAFWRYCKKRKWIKKNPSKILKSAKHNYSFRPVLHQSANQADYEHVLRSLDQFVAHRNYQPRDIRDALIVSITADSSKRRSEIWSLRKDRVIAALSRGEKLQNGRTVYHVISGFGKTGQQTVRFYDETADLLRSWLNYLPPVATHIFIDPRTGKQLHIDYMASAFKRICEFAGVNVFRFQATRKRVVTDTIKRSNLKAGQLMAGHKDERTTQVYYQDLQDKEVDSVGSDLVEDSRGNGRILADLFFGRKST